MASVSALQFGLFSCLVLAPVSTLLQAEPADYYQAVDASSPGSLRHSLHEIVDDHHRFPYTAADTDTWDVLEIADEHQGNDSEIITIYRNASYPKQGGGNDFYNREHSWPNSYGFPEDGPDNYPFTDMHALFLADDEYNALRANKPFNYCDASCFEIATERNNGRGGGGGGYPGDSSWTTGAYTDGTWEVWNGRRGDIARALMYMDVRYEGGTHGVTGAAEPDLILTDDLGSIDRSNTGRNESVGYMGMLSVLLEWHEQDPVDMIEVQHHEAVTGFQGNRNPFVDHPEWAFCVFGGQCPAFAINAGISDAWYDPETAGQGFFIIVWENIQTVFLAWFTYDTERPPTDVPAILGEPGHRWMTAQGAYNGDTADLAVYVSSGGVFDSAEPPVGPPENRGTMQVHFTGCNAGEVRYDIPSLGLQGEVPIQRIVQDNVPFCESIKR